MSVLVTSWSLHLPGVDFATGLGPLPPLDVAPACPAERADERLLGRRGLLAKLSRHPPRAVRRPARARRSTRPSPPEDMAPRTAVIVSSNLGNVAAVHRI